MRTKKKNSRPVLNKRVLVKAARMGVRKATLETVKVMGYNVVALDGWVVQKYPNGNIIKVKQIEQIERPVKIILD